MPPSIQLFSEAMGVLQERKIILASDCIPKKSSPFLKPSRFGKMWRRAFPATGLLPCRSSAARRLLSSVAASSAVDSIILRSLKEHYLEVSKMTPPPKINPPTPFTIMKGALDRDGPVLRRDYKAEEITISVMRLSNIMPSGTDDDGDDSISQLFLHVDVSKPGRVESLHFLCGLYPDAVGIHSVCLRPKVIGGSGPANMSKYQGRIFQDLEQKMRDAFHMFVEARGINESLFSFLQAWLYVKDHRNLMLWFKSVGTFVNLQKSTSSTDSHTRSQDSDKSVQH